jgi:hypothetical protein
MGRVPARQGENPHSPDLPPAWQQLVAVRFVIDRRVLDR